MSLCVIRVTKKKQKVWLPVKQSLLPYCAERIAPKICQGQPPTFCSLCSNFHPNQFTFGRVIAECVKDVLLANRVFAIFARTSGPIEYFHDRLFKPIIIRLSTANL